ncbi:vesicle-trafficking protein SEC22c [Limanda limanda]|uniref:vesicle-trafficking protein SEC22c n=1 Tax=Limanda limanda TaxID=27771 RepID=UPI0029C605FF|nr:vesicle-trafficking protein SEC22c [Limanda limanda]XP_060950166.1 vesicle-trafficking protein SEC22c [Limanda limanda]
MSLILFAFVVRVRDGLPLSASTDFEHNQELQERKQQLRTISKVLGRFPDRGSVKGQELNIFFISSEGVSYMTVCHCSLPVAKAFCFLEDLRWEFTACFSSTVVTLAARPYPFLEFDGTIQKLKQQYNQSGGPALEVTLAEVQEDLRIHPLQVINLDEVELTNGIANGHMEQGPGSGPNVRLQPVTAPGILSLVLNIVCASLNVIRGVHLIENTFQDDYEGIWNVVAFLLAFVCCVSQCHLYLFHSSLKKLVSFTLLSVVVLCNLYLLGLRNIWQMIFHISVASLSTGLTLTRKVQDRTNDCGV